MYLMNLSVDSRFRMNPIQRFLNFPNYRLENFTVLSEISSSYIILENIIFLQDFGSWEDILSISQRCYYLATYRPDAVLFTEWEGDGEGKKKNPPILENDNSAK